MAVIGDTGQFVTLGKKRVPRLEDSGVIRMTVDFAKGESARTILVYSPTAPRSYIDYGAVASESYDQASGRYTVTLAPGPNGTARLNLARGPMPSLARRPSKPVSQSTSFK
jgi:hypothetical protein